MKSRDKFISKTIEQARKKWAIDEQWSIDWEWDEACPSSAAIDLAAYTEKKAVVSLHPNFHKESDLSILRRDLYHELGHIILYPIYRGASDWADHTIKAKKTRAIYEEQFNTRENETIDHIVTKVFKI